MKKNIQNVTFNGQIISLKQLKSTLTNSQALIIRNFLYYMENDPYLITFDNALCVYKTMQEWIDDLTMYYENGKIKKMSKSTLCGAFSELLKLGLITKHQSERRTILYSLNEDIFAAFLKKHFPKMQLSTTDR